MVIERRELRVCYRMASHYKLRFITWLSTVAFHHQLLLVTYDPCYTFCPCTSGRHFLSHLLLCVKRACYVWQPSYVIVACTLFFVCALALHVSCFTVVTGTNYLPSGYKFNVSVKYSCTVWLILWLNGTYVSSSSILSQALLEYKHQLAWLSILLLPSSSFV